MFADISPRWATDVFPDDRPWIAPILIHGNDRTPWEPNSRAVRSIADHLDEPTLRRSRGLPTPVASVWHITIADIPDIADLDDIECAAISKDIAVAAGIRNGQHPTTRWVAARSHQTQTLHVIASAIGDNGEPVAVDRDNVHRACRGIEQHIHAQNHAPLDRTGAEELDHGAVVIRDTPSLGVAHTVGADHLAELLLKKAGFRPHDLGSGFQAWRTPYGADLDQRAHIAGTALDLLSAVGYHVSIQTSLLTRPMPDHDIGRAERRIADLTEQLGFCSRAEDIAEITAEIDAALHQTIEFTRALGTWTDRHLGDSAYTTRLADAATLLDQAAAVINRDPAEAPDPRPVHMVTRAATTRTTTPGATTTPTTPTPPNPAGSQPRHTR
jgi:hypothetical protein